MNNIELKENELIDAITASNEYLRFIEAKEMLDNNIYLKELIDNIKSLQKEIVKAENKGNIEQVKEKTTSLELFNKELSDNPIYVNYKNRLDDVNNILLVVKQNLEHYFLSKVN